MVIIRTSLVEPQVGLAESFLCVLLKVSYTQHDYTLLYACAQTASAPGLYYDRQPDIRLPVLRAG